MSTSQEPRANLLAAAPTDATTSATHASRKSQGRAAEQPRRKNAAHKKEEHPHPSNDQIRESNEHTIRAEHDSNQYQEWTDRVKLGGGEYHEMATPASGESTDNDMIDDGSQSVKIGSCGVVRERLKERVERGRGVMCGGAPRMLTSPTFGSLM